MPYLILIAGILVGIYALMKFFQSATPAQVVALMQAVFSVLLLGGCLLLALTGRIGPAIAIMGALVPMFAHYMFSKRKKAEAAKDAGENGAGDAAPSDGYTISSRKEALDILGLTGEPSPADIKAAYKDLMKKLHPDHGGNDYFAHKLSAARDYLLK